MSRSPRTLPRPAFLALCCLTSVAATTPLLAQRASAAPVRQPTLGARSAPVIASAGLRFRDLNRSGALEPYEDWRLDPGARARDLVARLTLQEKAGAMMHGTARSTGPMGAVGVGAAYDTAAMRRLLGTEGINHFITRLGTAPALLAAEHNRLQEVAESTRLGIPVTVSTDPRHHFQYVLGASAQTGQFSQWPETLGLAALGDPALVRRFADIARQEYRAVGIHMTLSPQADLATEPRWSRINGTFGEAPERVAPLVQAYVEGFQGGTSGGDSTGVLAVVKHWVGYGAARDGFDSHSFYGRFASITEEQLAPHVAPFLGAFASNVAGVMPTYSILQGMTLGGAPLEPVGAAYNRQLVTDLLRTRHRYDGVVLTDWAITNDCNARCVEGVPAGQRPSFADLGMPWGVEALTKPQRFAKAVQAGVDQFGGTEEAGALMAAVRAGLVREARLDSSVVRLMTQKFRLGLFENPYVDTAAAGRVVGSAAFREAALDAQRRALVLLENSNGTLPVRQAAAGAPTRVYLHRIDSIAAQRLGWQVVRDPAQADLAIMRLDAPFETLHPGYVFGAMQHEGELGFRDGDPEFEAFKRVSAAVPTVVSVYLDRPAILTRLQPSARAIFANFGVSDEALLDVIAGRAAPEGRLPFELPSSMADVRAQRPDVPHDTARPLYPIGFGRRY